MHQPRGNTNNRPVSRLQAVLQNAKPCIPDDLISSFNLTQTDFLKSVLREDALPTDTRSKWSSLLDTVRQYLPLSAESRRKLYEHSERLKRGEVLTIGSLETTLWKTGGSVVYTPTDMIISTGAGEIITTKNSLVPNPKGMPRPGINAMVAYLGSFIKIVKGKIHPIVINGFSSRWIRNVSFSPLAYFQVVDLFSDFVSDMPQWKAISGNDDTLSRERAVAVLYELLMNMEESLYYYLHTFLVFEVLTPFAPTTGKNKEYKYTNNRIVINKELKIPEGCYASVSNQVSRFVVTEIRNAGYPDVMVYRGGLKPQIRVGESDTLIKTVATQHVAALTRGSDKTAGSFLSLQQGYSGVATDLVRRIQRAVAMVGGLLRKNPNMVIDIQVVSTGDIEIIGNSLRTLFPLSLGWKFYVESMKKHAVSSSYRDRITTVHRADAHYLSYQNRQMTSYKNATDVDQINITQANYEKLSSSWYPEFPCTGYTMYETLFGAFPWTKPKEDGKEALSTSRSFIEKAYPSIPHYVYKFSLADKFVGIVTTQRDYALFGQEATVTKVGGSPKLSLTPVDVELKLIESESSWYNIVAADNARRESWWCNFTPKYSPVSNVLVIPRSGIAIVELDNDTQEIRYDDIAIDSAQDLTAVTVGVDSSYQFSTSEGMDVAGDIPYTTENADYRGRSSQGEEQIVERDDEDEDDDADEESYDDEDEEEESQTPPQLEKQPQPVAPSTVPEHKGFPPSKVVIKENRQKGKAKAQYVPKKPSSSSRSSSSQDTEPQEKSLADMD